MYGKNKNLYITYNIFFLHFQLKSLFNLLCEPILSTETNEFGNEMYFSEGPIVSLSSFYTKTWLLVATSNAIFSAFGISAKTSPSMRICRLVFHIIAWHFCHYVLIVCSRGLRFNIVLNLHNLFYNCLVNMSWYDNVYKNIFYKLKYSRFSKCWTIAPCRVVCSICILNLT